MSEEILLALLTLIPLGFAFWGQRAWRKGHRKAVSKLLLGAILVGFFSLLVATLRWDGSPSMLVDVLGLVGSVFLLGPALGLLIGLIIGVARGPLPAQGLKP